MGLTYKTITYSKSARAKLKAGVDKLANAVSPTLGPKGRNVVIDKELSRNPIITKDGVTVAKEVELKDGEENIGVRFARQSAMKTGDVVGDGTTTSIVLTQAIFNEGLRYVDAHLVEQEERSINDPVLKQHNPVDIIRGMNKAKDLTHEFLTSIHKDVSSKEDIQRVATISANNDSEIGNLIAEAMSSTDKETCVVVEQSTLTKTTLELIKGLKYDNSGYVIPHLATDQQKGRTELSDQDVPIVFVNSNITSHIELLNMVIAFQVAGKKDVVIMAHNFTGSSLDFILQNYLQGAMRIHPVKAPSYGVKQIAIVEDLAVATGAKVISETTLKAIGCKMEELGNKQITNKQQTPKVKHDIDEFVGTARKIIIDKNTITILDGAGTKENIQERIDKIDYEIEQYTDENEKDYARKRKARMISGIANIKVGGVTEAEVIERKDRMDDAVSATRAAIEGGIIPGGGIGLLRASQYLESIIDKQTFVNDDEKIGYQIICESILSPFQIILRNAGLNIQEVMANVKSNTNVNYGLNVANEKYGDLLIEGVIDPVLVTKVALENAVSSASMLLTTECILKEQMDDKMKMQMLDPSNNQY